MYLVAERAYQANLFIYLPAVSERSHRFLDLVRQLPSGVNTEVFEKRGEFIGRLRQPKDNGLITILFDPSREDLEGMDVARQFLSDVPLLLVLSDQEPETLALAYRLLPSYITYVDSDLSQLLAVVKKLLPAGQAALQSRSEFPE
jgi:hypothetical protein